MGLAGKFRDDVCVVGGCGHVGLPLAITLASRGLKVTIQDINHESVELVKRGEMPFLETGAQAELRKVVGKNLKVGTDPALISEAQHVIVVIGTPVDEHLNPTYHTMRRFFEGILPRFVAGQCIIMRSTVYPGTTEKIHALIQEAGLDARVAFCPERVAEGKAMEELVEQPQIVSGCDPQAEEMAAELFGKIARSIIRLTPLEAELTKIFTNVWRYIQFATANQFFMIATDYGLDFYKLFGALTQDYPRMSGLPKSGFAAGPCLFKDTMQLSAAYDNHFALGHAAMLVNEGLPNFLVSHARKRWPLSGMKAGILGMAFKADSDDPRESLSFKLRKVLTYEAAGCLCADAYIEEADYLPAEELVARADVVFVGAPHKQYRALQIPPEKPLVDVWNLYGRGVFSP